MRKPAADVRIEGYTPEELLALPDTDLDGLLAHDRPIVFRVGSATILGQVRVVAGAIVVEVAHVDGGGEGVLPVLWNVVSGIARRRNWERVEWIVHATRCAKPNPALRRVLQRKGFTLCELPTIGQVYFLAVDVPSAAGAPGVE
jgi:hypothetical protein